MLQLLINSRPAVIKQGTSFKLTRENPLYEDAGDWTLDVTLPLDGCRENLDIFGAPLHRPELSLATWIDAQLPFSLVAPPLSITGKAIVTNITQEEAKVQLVANNSQLNLSKKDIEGNDLYIDELDLGKAYDETEYADYIYTEERTWGRGRNAYITPRDRIIERIAAVNARQYGTFSDGNKCVSFPVWSEQDEEYANAHHINRHPDSTGQLAYSYTFLCGYYHAQYQMADVNYAAQPYLVHIIQRLLDQLGYTITSNAILGTWMENIFIANARSEYKYANILPHWTVKEFVEEACNFFGVRMVCGANNVQIIKRSEYYNDTTNYIHIKNVIDEHTAELEVDEEVNDTQTGNVDYDHDSVDNMARLPDEVWENAIIMQFVTESEMVQWIAQNLTDAQKKASAHLFVVTSEKKVFAHIKTLELDSDNNNIWSLAQVDVCPPLIRRGEQFGKDRRDIDVTLRIVPIKMDAVALEVKRYNENHSVETFQFYIPGMVSSNTVKPYMENYNINDVINPENISEEGENSVDSKPDIIEVAYNPGTTLDERITLEDHPSETLPQIPSALGIAYYKKDGYYLPVIQKDSMTGIRHNDHFRLTNTTSPSLRADALDQDFRIDTRLVRCFKFTDRLADYDPTAIYIIRGRKYVVQKIELTIDDQGIQPLKTAYFYEVNE